MTLLEMPGLEEPNTGPIHPGQWRLARVELLNWGTFHGLHAIDVARQGHLFTGASGSGKSSLLDAIATVLTPDKWLRFNAAAQESAARSGDRSIVSYVRGAWSKEADANEDRAVSTYLRKGATWSGILLRFDNERDAPVTLVRLFHLRGTSVDKADLRDACVLDRGALSLLDFREFVESGIEAKRLKAAWPDAVVTTNGSHTPFYSRLRRLLGIGSDNALHLLHKTQSAKNLGTLDQLFRSFMLDVPPTFARAKNAVEQFDELNQAHQHVVELRRQAEALTSLEASIVQYEKAMAAGAEAERLSALIDPFQDALIAHLADDERALRRAEHARVEEALARAIAARLDAEERLSVAMRNALQLGGATAAQLQVRLADAHAAADLTTARWRRFAEQLAGVGIVSAPNTAAEFAELRESTRRLLEQHAPVASHEHSDHAVLHGAKSQLEAIDRELLELRSRKSNLPAPLLVARRQLAAELKLNESELPFAGELIEVQPEFADWTGAIERVLYPIASALLVRDQHLAEVRRRVESRNLGARLVFEAIPALSESPRPTRSPQSLLGRVRVSDGPFQSWLRARLSVEFDYACVDTPDKLDAVDRGVTIGGQVKKSARRYEKNDRFSVDDRRQWILGADNEAKIELLLDQRRNAKRALDEAGARLDAVQAQRDQATRRRAVLEGLLALEWVEVDRVSAAELVRSRQSQLDELTADDAPLTEAIAAEKAARELFTEADERASQQRLALDRVTVQLAELDEVLARFAAQPDRTVVTEADAAVLDARYRAIQRKLDRSAVENVGRKVAAELNRQSHDAQNSLRQAESRFVSGASEFKLTWPAAASELTPSIDDRAGYRALLEGIVVRGLPEHEQNFLKLLRDKSRDVIAHLLSDIRDAPKLVVDRIDPVNASLGRSRFDVERYLSIDVKTRRTAEVNDFIVDLKTVVDGNWGDDDLVAAEQRFAVLNEVMHKLGSSENTHVGWRNRVLDTREHVTFMALEKDLAGRVLNVHDSSAGLSGGQRQKLVIFCLAAALRYQLAADEDVMPSYATIILDEAFDKADSRYTRMAMDVFVEFGFHLLLATPEKLLQTIEPYVGAVTAVTNPTRSSSETASLMFRVVER